MPDDAGVEAARSAGGDDVVGDESSEDSDPAAEDCLSPGREERGWVERRSSKRKAASAESLCATSIKDAWAACILSGSEENESCVEMGDIPPAGGAFV